MQNKTNKKSMSKGQQKKQTIKMVKQNETKQKQTKKHTVGYA